MTDKWDVIFEGASVAHGEDLHRLGSTLTAVCDVLNDPSPQALDNLREWAAKVATDLINHKNKKAAS